MRVPLFGLLHVYINLLFAKRFPVSVGSNCRWAKLQGLSDFSDGLKLLRCTTFLIDSEYLAVE